MLLPPFLEFGVLVNNMINDVDDADLALSRFESVLKKNRHKLMVSTQNSDVRRLFSCPYVCPCKKR